MSARFKTRKLLAFACVKAPACEDALSLLADQQAHQNCWARPLQFIGESNAGGEWFAPGRGPLANELEWRYPPRPTSLRTQRREVDSLTKVGLLARQQHVGHAEQLVRQRDDGNGKCANRSVHIATG